MMKKLTITKYFTAKNLWIKSGTDAHYKVSSVQARIV